MLNLPGKHASVNVQIGMSRPDSQTAQKFAAFCDLNRIVPMRAVKPDVTIQHCEFATFPIRVGDRRRYFRFTYIATPLQQDLAMKGMRPNEFRIGNHRATRRRCLHGFGISSTVEVLEERSLLTGTAVAGLVDSWNFDEGPDWHDSAFQAPSAAVTADDTVGEHPANLTNMTAASWVSGQQFTALQFDGVNDYLSVTGDLGPTLGGTFSLAFWIKTSQIGDANPLKSPGIVGSSVVQTGGIDASGRIGMSIGSQWLARTAIPINDDRWHFVVISRDATTGDVRTFLDGQLSGSITGPVGQQTTAITAIGRRNTAMAPSYFAGRLDQVSLFNTVLEANAIALLQDNYAPKTWDTQTDVVTGQTFSTTSVFFKAFDPEGDSLSVISFTQPAHGMVTDNQDGTFNYTSNVGFVGSDHFQVTIEDGRGGFSQSTMSLKVLPTSTGNINQFTADFDDFVTVEAGGNPVIYDNHWRIPRSTDWDGDGLTDLLVSADNFIWLYHNSGTAQSPVFDAGVKIQAAGTVLDTGSTVISIALADMTGDGIDDLILTDDSLRLRVYRNTSVSGQVPVYAAPVFLKDPDGSDFVMENPRFDLGDWNDDGLLDIIVGAYSGEVNAFLNVGSGADPQFSTIATNITSESYNFYPRWIDLSRNGIPDMVRGINWGNIVYRLDPILHANILSQSPLGYLSISGPDTPNQTLQDATDGPTPDFADFNGDGVLDLVIGGQLAGDRLFLAYGQAKGVTGYIADLEAIYDAHTLDLGAALEANGQELLAQVRTATQGIINLLNAASPADRQAIYTAFAAHVARYSFLRLQPLDTAIYHHVPSLVVQDILIAGNILPDTPARRLSVANLFGMTGLHRELYLEFRYVVGDNVQASQGQLQSILTFLRQHPRESYADQRLSLDNFFGDGNGAGVDSFGQAKNTFGNDTGLAIDEWSDDLRDAILAVKPSSATSGDLFTFVLGHEATHALDAYIRSRPNADLARRWGQYLVLAGGPDIIAGSDGFMDLAATQQHFLEAGYWDGQAGTWSQAWDDYWNTGPGAGIKLVNNLRGNIDFLLANPQESLATQGNQHWVDSEGRIIGAIDRFQRGITPDLTEALTFLEFQSVGMNRVPMFDIEANAMTQQADWTIAYADLERDDLGHITRLIMSNGRQYSFTVNALGVYTGVVVGAPQLVLTVGDIEWTSNEPPVVVLPQISVAGTADLGGGTLTLTSNAIGSRKKARDQFTVPASSELGTSTELLYEKGQVTLQIQLQANVNPAAIQSFLRSLTFSTKGKGLKVLTRTLNVTLADRFGQTSSVSQTIHVRKKALAR